MTETELRSLAIAATSQAIDASVDLMNFAREGDQAADGPFKGEPIEQLCDATKMALEIQREAGPLDDERAQLLAALCNYLDGWWG